MKKDLADQLSADSGVGERTIELAMIIPVMNEAGNVREMVKRLDQTLADTTWEAIFVDDDSTDGTPDIVREIAAKDRRVRLIHRIGRRGLSSAVVEGMLATSAPYMAVIDGDLQHDETAVPKMLKKASADNLDIVLGTRYAEGGGFGDWAKSRLRMSQFATKLSNLVLPVRVSDPMSGFFLISRPAFHNAVRKISGSGFKILLDLMASSPKDVRVGEVAYTFRSRVSGESKLDSTVMLEFGELLLDKTVGRFVPTKFLIFSAIGGLGLVVHLMIVGVTLNLFGFGFAVAQATGTLVAMTFNYTLNNFLTYRDRRLKGMKFFGGMVSFFAVCSVGAIANVGIANSIYERDTSWIIAGTAGALVGAVWNYAVSSVFTWRK